MKKTGLTLLLVAIVCGLIFWIWSMLSTPIKFESHFAERSKAVIEKEQHIIKGGKVLASADFNKDYFTEIDIRVDSVFPLYAKHAKLLTVHPAGSYEFTKDESKQLTLSIIDAEAFWSVSRYMVVQVR